MFCRNVSRLNGLIVGGIVGMLSLTLVAAEQSPQKRTAKKPIKAEVQLPQNGVVRLLPTKDSKVHGILWLTQTAAGLNVKGEVQGLEPGLHGFHIHEFGDLSDSEGKSAGGHFNPTDQAHGAPEADHHHVGDLGNIQAAEDGTAKINMNVPSLKLHIVIGRSFVVHANADDLKSQPSGDAGDRQAVGVIGIAGRKVMKK